MREKLMALKEKLIDINNSFDKRKKILVYGGSTLFVIILTMIIINVTKTEYVPIAHDLTYDEASKVTTKLDELSIPWDGSSDMSIISVPENQVSKAKMELAVSNVYNEADYTWVDVFKSESITTTSETREQMYREATASGIAQAIETIEGISDAKVRLVLPKESAYFENDDTKAKASVILTLEHGFKITEDQVNGIVSLMENSVKGLEKENISVLDNKGIKLNEESSEESFVIGNQYEMQISVEKQLKRNIETFLGNIFGYENVKVVPAVTLDFNKQSETQTLFSPPIASESNGMVRSSTKISETVKNSADAGGVPGSDSNGGATSYSEQNDDQNSYQNASETLNYELNKISKQIISAEGEVKDLSIAVLINTNALIDNQLTEDYRNELIELVAYSAGTDATNITVRAYPFANDNYDYITDNEVPTIIGLPYWAVMIMLVIIIIAIIILVFVQLKKYRKREEQRQIQMKKDEEARLREITTDNEDTESPKYHIEKFVDKNPEAAATLLRAWINED